MKTLKILLCLLVAWGGMVSPCFAYYNQETDRFLTEDPAGFVDGPNEFVYVQQNPWTRFDPEGLSAYSDMEGAAQRANDQGQWFKSLSIILAQKSWQMASLGTASRNGDIQDDILRGKIDPYKGVGAMWGNGGVAAGSLLLGGGTYNALKGSAGVIQAGLASGAVQSLAQVGGQHMVAAGTGTPHTSLGDDVHQVLTTTALSGALSVVAAADVAIAANRVTQGATRGLTPTPTAQSIFIQNKFGNFAGSYDPATQTLKVGIVNSYGEPGQNFSTELYRQAIAEAKGPVKAVTGYAGGDNLAEITKSDGNINAAPRAKSLGKLGYSDHAYDPQTKQMTSTKPEPEPTGD